MLKNFLLFNKKSNEFSSFDCSYLKYLAYLKKANKNNLAWIKF